ncbi:hypothetical protein ACLB9X_19360 [Streptomyces sp. 5K101]|uniref:hypothetical protein n=1 Tax=Streptomyces sp. 5K101 TaxID=3390037 RepID=UPI003974CED3
MDSEIREERGNCGRKPLAREREEYLRLVDLGIRRVRWMYEGRPMESAVAYDLPSIGERKDVGRRRHLGAGLQAAQARGRPATAGGVGCDSPDAEAAVA